MVLKSIFVQYALETLVLTSLVLGVFPRKRRDPSRALKILTGLNMLRFGGVAGAFAALHASTTPAFLIAVALGDGLAATLAVIAFVLLIKRSPRAVSAVIAMNGVGILGILMSETWLELMQRSGTITLGTLVHGPSIGAAFYTALHLLAFALVARARKGALPVPTAMATFSPTGGAQ